MIAPYQTEFIEFALSSDVLKFGEFELKSGRISPYFFNSGLFNGGRALARLGGFYARALLASGIPFDMLFGPAYKGIPLVSATAISLFLEQGTDVPYAFNRKEAKTHGEGGRTVGAPLQGKIVIVDDVITAGTAIREIMVLMAELPVEVTGVLIAIDRQEKGQGELSAIKEVEEEYGVSVASVVKLDHLIEYLSSNGRFSQQLERMQIYRNTYGTG